MPKPSSISRRIQSCLAHTHAKEYEEAMIDFFPALDKTAKRRRSNGKVGDRIKKFISEQEAIISTTATGNVITGIVSNGISFPEAIYKFGRNTIAHEGELDPRLNFNDSRSIMIGDAWNLPSTYIIGLCVGVMSASENKDEFIDTQSRFTILGREFAINEVWGAEKIIGDMIKDKFRWPRN